MAEPGTYRMIAEGLRRRILVGDFKAGELMPSEARLVEQLGVARGTVRAALALLADERLIEVVPGQGRRVIGRTRADRPPATAYEQIAADLRRRLAAQEFGANEQLPSEAELVAAYRVSRNTVRRAYRDLVEQGLVVVRHGAGAFPATQ